MPHFKHLRHIFLAGSVSLLGMNLGNAQPAGCSSDAFLVFDGSGSMAEMGYNGLDQPRIFEARVALARALPLITPHRALGLITYGPGPASEACSNIILKVPPARDTAAIIMDEIERLQPDGKTALTSAVSRAVEQLRQRGSGGDVVLVTDGKETCGGAPCQLAADIAARGTGITVHVIGFRVRRDQFQWESVGEVEGISVARCLAEQTGGSYHAAEGIDQLVGALIETLGCSRLSQPSPTTIVRPVPAITLASGGGTDVAAGSAGGTSLLR